MAPNKGRDRAGDFAALSENGVRDFDPEEDNIPDEDGSENDSQSEEEEHDSREHYVNVGKSKLRQPKAVALGPQYRGSRVSRDAIIAEEDNDDDDDPFDRGFDDEDDEVDEEEEDSDIEESAQSEEVDGVGTSDTDLSEDEEANFAPRRPATGESVKEQLRKGLSSDMQRAATASISQANQEDAEKGEAVKRQRSAFDALLNVRMKLQKSLVATNTLAGIPSEQIETEREDVAQIFEAAETAAFNLWDSLTSLREDLAAARTGSKRKRATFTPETPIKRLLTHAEAQETDSRPLRDSVLRKWSQKSQGPTVVPERSRLNPTEGRATIIDVLREQLSQPERLLQRTYAPRSCAPLQLAQKITEDENIYDDADFYSLLLKELLEQKSQDSAAAGAAANIDFGFQMRREAKTRRNVDTKASKGRKLRYTVHEKLQNFMAPEDRSSWGERQADDLFRSLFGQQLGLGEDDHEQLEDVTMIEEEVDPEAAGLMMFRS